MKRERYIRHKSRGVERERKKRERGIFGISCVLLSIIKRMDTDMRVAEWDTRWHFRSFVER